MKAIILFLLCILLFGCLKGPSATMTDEYISLVKPGQDWALVEIGVNDSTTNLPNEYDFVTSYVVVNRHTKERIRGNKTIKMFYSKKHRKYQWARLKDRLSDEFEYSDTISLKSHIWYKISTSNYAYTVLFYWNGSKGDYVIRVKSNKGPW